MKRVIKFRAYTEISNEVLGMKYDVPHNYNDTVMQFTGLIDRNGKEIYEGDVVHNKSLSMKGEVKVGSHETSLGKYYGWYIHRYMKIGKDKATSWESPHWEIIGNKYESKHLLDNTDTKV